jgi:hypothetical protein
MISAITGSPAVAGSRSPQIRSHRRQAGHAPLRALGGKASPPLLGRPGTAARRPEHSRGRAPRRTLPPPAASSLNENSLDDRARELFVLGRDAYLRERSEEALRYFNAAFELSGRYELHYNIGQSAIHFTAPQKRWPNSSASCRVPRRANCAARPKPELRRSGPSEEPREPPGARAQLTRRTRAPFSVRQGLRDSRA